MRTLNRLGELVTALLLVFGGAMTPGLIEMAFG